MGIISLVFRKKDLYLVITQKLTFMKSGGFHVDFMKSGRFHVKSSGFHVKSTYKTYKSNISRKTLQFFGVLWKGYVIFSHEIRWISRNPPDFERPTIARNGKAYVFPLVSNASGEIYLMKIKHI